MKKSLLFILMTFLLLNVSISSYKTEKISIKEEAGNYASVEKTDAYLNALTKEQFEQNNMEYSNQKRFFYGLEVSAIYNGKPIPGVTYSILDSKGNNVVNDIYGREATGQTDSDGKLKFLLVGNADYVVRQMSIDEKYDIYKGEVKIDVGKPSIAEKGEDFAENQIVNYVKVTFVNDISDEEISMLALIEGEKTRIKGWREEVVSEINEIFNNIDTLKHNEEELKKLEAIRVGEIAKLDEVVNQYLEMAEGKMRFGERVDCRYTLEPYKARLATIHGHWEHWIILSLVFISAILHFFFNKHMLINIIDVAGIIVLAFDICLMSVLFLGLLVILNMIFTFIGSISDNNYEEVKEDRI